MTFENESSVSSRGLPLLRDLIHEETGIEFGDDMLDVLFDKIVPLAADRGFDALIDYYYLLKYDRDAASEWPRLFDALSVRETFFWREVDQIQVLAASLLPGELEKRPFETVRIWSAACATGEEPLSIAMALNEAGLFHRANIEIYASDASPQAIAIASNGLYRERSFRNLPASLREKYFTAEDGNRWRIRPYLQDRVRWNSANLMSNAGITPFAASRFVFCRNVFIYFSTRSVRRVVDLLADKMPHPGYLFLGAAESLLRINSKFNLQEIGGSFVYVRD